MGNEEERGERARWGIRKNQGAENDPINVQKNGKQKNAKRRA
jgi:hypothetical protein